MISDSELQDSNLNETRSGTVLNPNADAFFSSVNHTVSTTVESTGEPLTNGDLMQDDTGDGFSSGDSPASDSPPIPMANLDIGAVPEFGLDSNEGASQVVATDMALSVLGEEASSPENMDNSASSVVSTSGQLATSSAPVVNGFDDGPIHENAEGGAQGGSGSNQSVSQTELRRLLLNQLEYYFSRENLVQDHYLQSQMDGDQYVFITVIANFNQVVKLTRDLSFIVEILRSSNQVQVDETGTKVRPKHNRSVLMLREIPQDTPKWEVESLFNHEECPKFVNCEFAHNGYWYITFKTDEDASEAFVFLKKYEIKFKDKPVMARIKAKPLVRGGGISHFHNKPPRAQQQQQETSVPFMQQQPQYPLMPSAVTPFINQQQQIPQAVPFHLYNLQTAMVPQWTTTNTAPQPFMDPGTMLAINGYQAANLKTPANHGRNIFHTVRNNRGMGKPNHRPHTINADKIPESRPMDKHTSSGHSTTRANNRVSTHVSAEPTAPPSHSHSGNHSGRHRFQGAANIGHMAGLSHGSGSSALTPLVPDENLPLHSAPSAASSRQDSNSTSQHQRRAGNIRRSKRADEGAKNTRSQPNHGIKDGKPVEPQFELEATSFPPLPGSCSNSSASDTAEGSKLSDVVKGTTVRPSNNRSEDKVWSVPTATTVSAPPQNTPTLTSSAAPFSMARPTVGNTSASTNQTVSVSTTAVVSAATSSVAKEIDASVVSGYSPQSFTAASATGSTTIESATPVTKTTKPALPATVSKPTSEAQAASRQTGSNAGLKKQADVRGDSSVLTSNTETAPAKLSYAQMAAMASRKQPAENAVKPNVESGAASQDTSAALQPAIQLATQEQTKTQAATSQSSSVPAKSANVSARPYGREHQRNDSEPREQRFQGNKRTKDYHENRQSRFDRRRNERGVKAK